MVGSHLDEPEAEEANVVLAPFERQGVYNQPVQRCILCHVKSLEATAQPFVSQLDVLYLELTAVYVIKVERLITLKHLVYVVTVNYLGVQPVGDTAVFGAVRVKYVNHSRMLQLQHTSFEALRMVKLNRSIARLWE